jgi:outer membrane protein assembly factor BamB
MRFRNFVFVFYCIIIIGLLLWKNPSLLKSETLRSSIQFVPIKIYPTVKKAIEISTDTLSEASPSPVYFRENLHRQGLVYREKRVRQIKELWRVDGVNVGIHSASKASPVVDSSGVYIGGDNSWFFAYNHDGTLRWKYYVDQSSRGIHSTAAIYGDLVIFGTYSGFLYALEKSTGELVWNRKIGETFGSSPLIVEDSLIVSGETFRPDGFVVKMNPRNGDIYWVSEMLGEQSHASPVVDLESRQVFVGANNSKYFALDLDTGKTRWALPIGGPMKGTSLFLNGAVYFTDWGASFKKINAEKGIIDWSLPIVGKVQTSPIYFPKSKTLGVFDQEGNFSQVTEDGKVLWNKRIGEKWFIASPLAIVSEKEEFLTPCMDHDICLVDTKGKIQIRFPLKERLTGSFAPYGNKVYLVTNPGTLLALELN